MAVEFYGYRKEKREAVLEPTPSQTAVLHDREKSHRAVLFYQFPDSHRTHRPPNSILLTIIYHELLALMSDAWRAPSWKASLNHMFR